MSHGRGVRPSGGLDRRPPPDDVAYGWKNDTGVISRFSWLIR